MMADKARNSFLEDYITTLENLPWEIKRNFSLMRELDRVSEVALPGYFICEIQS